MMGMDRIYISWDCLIREAKDRFMEAIKEGVETDLMTEIALWLDYLLWEYAIPIVCEGIHEEWEIVDNESMWEYLNAMEYRIRREEEKIRKELEEI